MALDDLAEGDAGEIAVLVQNGVERVDLADPAHDLELLLVQRIAGEVALDRQRILHEPRRVKGAYGRVMGDAGSHHLASARPAGHEMRLDQAGRDTQVGLDEAPVDADRRRARGGHAEVDMRRIVPREMILDTDIPKYPVVADQFGEFRTLVRPMQAGRDEYGDRVARNPGGHHDLDHRPQEQMVGNRTGDVADQDAGAPAPTREFIQRQAADRVVEGGKDCARLIRQLGERTLAYHGRLGRCGQRDRAMAAAEGKIDLLHEDCAVLLPCRYSRSIGPNLHRREARGYPAGRVQYDHSVAGRQQGDRQ